MAFRSAIPRSFSSSVIRTNRKRLAVDMRPKIAGKYRIKFKAEILPLKDQVGGYRILYSHNCQFGASQMHETDRTVDGDARSSLPGIGRAKEDRRGTD